MKIGLVTPSWPGGTHANGITTTVAYLVAGLEALGHVVTVISLSKKQDDDPRCVNLPARRPVTLKERVLSALGSDDPLHQRKAEQIAAATNAAVASHGIEVLVMEETQGWVGIVAQLVSIPVVVTLHGPWHIQTILQSEPVSRADRRREKREAVALRHCAGITSPSQDVLDRTRAQVPDMAALQMVIPNPIKLKQPAIYNTLESQQCKSILFVGRHEHRKGSDILLQGFAELIALGADAYLTFVGPDNGVIQADGSTMSLPQSLKQLDDDVQSRITCLGLRSKAEIDDLRRSHLVTLVTSRYETFCYTLLEALASGSAAISTSAGGPSEIIRDEQTGLLIPPQDPTALAQACLRLLRDPDLAAKLGAAARLDVATRYAPEEIAVDLAGFLQQVVDQKGMSRSGTG